MNEEFSGALKGLKVLDLTRALAGPFCTMLLADQGAEVIKVEAVGSGDGTRVMPPFRPDQQDRLPYGGYFHSVNRNKQSVAIDLKAEEGKALIRTLVQECDVLVENFRAGVMEGLGLSYESLAELNPRLVYATIRGFGDPRTGESPYCHWPAYDVIAQSMGGMMSITGPAGGEPTKVGPGVGDLIPGALAAVGVLSAVYEAQRSGRGQFVDVAMYDAILAFCERMVPQYSFEGVVPGPVGNAHGALCPFGTFPASDGYVAIACPGDNFWRLLCEEMGRPELIEDERFRRNYHRTQHQEACVALISDWTRQFTRKELASKLGGKIPFGPVQNVKDIFEDPHVAVRHLLAEVEQPGSATPVHIPDTPIKMTRTPGGVRRRAPLLGEDTDSVLRRYGLTDDQIADLRARKIVG
ncbi:MAG: CoA transferase [Pseudomonadales bacterium]|nr:CoA transferase [Pseudomonadales bacterium]